MVPSSSPTATATRVFFASTARVITRRATAAKGNDGWVIRLQPRAGGRYALRSAAAAGLRSRKSTPLSFRFRRQSLWRTVTQHLRRPCQVSFHGDYAVVSELEGRVTILDRDNVPVAFLGDNPQKTQWANYDLEPDDITRSSFSAAHGCFIDKDANIYVSDWNRTGRVTKLERSAT